MGVRQELMDIAVACGRGYEVPQAAREKAMETIQKILGSNESSNREKLSAINALVKIDDFNRRIEQSERRRVTVLGVAKLLGIDESSIAIANGAAATDSQ